MKGLFALSLHTDLHRTVIFSLSPLKPKLLDSIMDLDRSITKSPEELTSIWYDVISLLCPLKISSMMSLDLLMYHLGRGHIRITMKASHFIVCWSNKQPSAVTLLFHGGEEMVTLQCLLKDGSSGVFFCIHYGTDALSETDATSTKHSLRNTLFHFTCGKRLGIDVKFFVVVMSTCDIRTQQPNPSLVFLLAS
ncbi:LOW QUALITY PROTEIN: hypothetical protein HID58_047605 [Brassica napus]|uniref:Uncharacterized protein n=1 Tax=Brassica napus TaxID=3708 RepID=A0ABQ8AZT2_BRANA|nr:LOW QUALITY PROTEIN: hypothetical protein HID58_047605 [Brassica napus]